MIIPQLAYTGSDYVLSFMRSRLTLIFLLLTAVPAYAQPSPQLSAAEIKLALNKLNVLGSVLYVGAHPDDENTRLLAWLAREKLYRTAYLSLTRGDGGQNLIGSEQAEQLGLIRTQELLAARRVDGAEQFFTRANDFGFSKTADETLKIWNHDHILGDVVWVIRKFRPDVIITRFTDDARAGHGHHQASSILAQEAFDAAADPKRFPGQLRFVKPWQAKRILLNGFGGASTGGNQLSVAIDAYNKLLGKGYGEIAAESRSNHKSQGFGSAKQRGPASETFSLWKGAIPQNSLMDDVETGWKRIPGGEKAGALAAQAANSFNMENPEKTVPTLLSLLSEVETLPDEYWREQKSKEIKDLILACAGIWFESYAARPFYPCGSIPVTTQAINRSSLPVKIVPPGNDANQAITNLDYNKPATFESTILAPYSSQPYYLTEDHSPGEYGNGDERFYGYPENPDLPAVTITLLIGGKRLSYERTVVYKYTDQVRGEVYSSLVVTPAVTLSLQKKVLLFTGDQPQSVSVTIKTFTPAVSGTLALDLPKGWTSEPASVPFKFTSEAGDEQVITFSVSGSAAAEDGMLIPVATVGGNRFSSDIRTINYEHIPSITWFPRAAAQIRQLDLKRAGQNIAYIPGAGDLVPDMLEQIGYKVSRLSSEQVPSTDLSAFDAVITGVRAYNVDQNMKLIQPKLLDYVKNGGTLLVQYNVNRPLVMTDIGPYPFTISGTRVTEEDAKVTITHPEDPVLNYPNKITAADFDGWIQERGIYFGGTIDPQYRTPLSMGDTGERQSNGSLLVADYGKGRFVYTSLVFFRELPAGVPGAYRLFLNLIAKKP
jgi:LmbE family N-acetylglucosaminyl deacetylase